MRLLSWLVMASFAVVLVVPAGVFGMLVAQERAMNRCTATPPGFPRSLSRAGTEVTVEWKLLPLTYECVYETPGRIVRRPPPASP
jgi:hypothetical protein